MGWIVIVILASWEYHFIRVHENLVQYPSNYISIVTVLFCCLPGKKETVAVKLIYDPFFNKY